MTSAELARYDGRDGKPAYVAVSGTIYDVSGSRWWQDGNHADAHQAGQDLTEELKSAPHVRAVIERFPVVGKLEADEGAATKSAAGLSPVSIIIMLVVLGLLVYTFIF